MIIALVPTNAIGEGHMTLAYSENTTESSYASWCQRVGALAPTLPKRSLSVVGTGQLGEGKWAAEVVYLDPKQADIYRQAVADLCESEHPEWLPHLSLSYGEDEYTGTMPTSIEFDRMEVWADGDFGRYSVPLAEPLTVSFPLELEIILPSESPSEMAALLAAVEARIADVARSSVS